MDLTTLSAQLGATGVTVYIAYITIKKLYEDMRADSTSREQKSDAREEKLMLYLNSKLESDKKMVDTLEKLDVRMCNLEDCMKSTRVLKYSKK